MDLMIWIPAMLLLGLVGFALLFAFRGGFSERSIVIIHARYISPTSKATKSATKPTK